MSGVSRPVLGGCLVALAILAYGLSWQNRPWKKHQRQYLDARVETLEQRLDEARSQHAKDITFHQNGVQVAFDEQREHADAITRLQRELRAFERQLRRAEQQRSLLQNQLRTASDPQRRSALRTEQRERRIEAEGFRELADDRSSQLNRLTADLQQAELLLQETQQPVDEIERQLQDATVGAWWRWPVLRWFDPRLQIRQISPRLSQRDASHGATRTAATRTAATRTAVVDRCVTCHVGMVLGEAGAGPILGAHPRPELYVAPSVQASSVQAPPTIHALEDVGCTSCHGGDGRATDFVAAGHLPKGQPQAESWQQEFGWRPGRLDKPILTGGLVESTCASCHGPGLVTAEASLERAGRSLLQGLACASCHGDSGVTGNPGVTGPPLQKIASKTTRPWLQSFLEDPAAYSASSWMPRMWPTDSDAATRRVEIQAVVEYLWQRSSHHTYAAPPDGDSQRGGRLFNELGCRACHTAGDHLAAPLTDHPDPPTRLPGPDLAALATKTHAGWLYSWLLDPTSYRHDTRMPDFRLAASQAADLTAFLVAEPTTSLQAWPPIDSAIVDRLVAEQLEQDLTIEQAAASLELMAPEARVLYLGERTLIDRSCHRCHALPGIEFPTVSLDVQDAPQLEQIAEDLLTRVARGEDLSRWLHSSPAAERAGEYPLTARETRALAIHLLSFVPRPGTAALPDWHVAGEQVLERHACRACHSLDGVGGLGDLPAQQRPPALDDIGAKLNPAWLFQYLAEPSEVLRPWLTSRMPNHHLSAEERSALVTYFARRADRDLLIDSPQTTDATSLAVGGAVFNMLQCNRCHVDYGDRGGIAVSELAPRYQPAGRRLRPDWAERWILDPRSLDPQTAMPQSFPRGPDGQLDGSFLIGTLGAPMFQVQRLRLERFFASEEEMQAYLSDPEHVARALRDYLWSLESP